MRWDRILPMSGTLTQGVNAVQTANADAAAAEGSFMLSFGGVKTAAIAWNATAAAVQAALEAHASIGTGNITVTGGTVDTLNSVDMVITFIGALAGMPNGAITVTDATTLLDGPLGSAVTITITADTVTGVVGTYRGFPLDTLVMKTDGVGIVYYNAGTSNVPVWTAMEESARLAEPLTYWKSTI